MKKTIFIMAILCIGMVGSVQAITVDLIAGQDMPVGTVEVTWDGGDILVKYMLDGDCDGVLLTETHLHVSNAVDDFHGVVTNKGNPKIGKFDYSMDHDPGVTEYEYRVLAGNLPSGGPPYYIAAHGVTGTEYCSADELPGIVTAELTWDQSLDTYFKLVITSDDALNGEHGAWCADVDLDAVGGSIDWIVDSSVPAEINCLLNNDYVGEIAADGEAFTIGDVQLAIWILFDDDLDDLDDLKAVYPGKVADLLDWFGPQTGSGLAADQASQAAHIAQILEDVADCDLIPGCCDVMGILLYPPLAEPLNQPILIAIPAPCCETVWGFGGDAVGIPFAPTNPNNGKRSGSWAMYFMFGDPS